jgi:predicted nucleic acid-binding protein
VILLDSNVLVYAVGRSHPLARVAEDLLAFADTGRFRVTARVLEESAHVNARIGRRRVDARELAGEWAATLGPVEYAAEEDVADGFELWVAHDQLDLADGILAAQAKRLDAHLVSADRAFADVPQLHFVHLADPDLAEKLGIAN